MYLIYRCLSSASAVIRLWFVYELQKSIHNDTCSVFKELTLHFQPVKSPPCLRISNRKYPPMPSEFHNREPPLPFGNPKSRPWYRYRYFLELPNTWRRLLHLLYDIDFMRAKQ